MLRWKRRDTWCGHWEVAVTVQCGSGQPSSPGGCAPGSVRRFRGWRDARGSAPQPSPGDRVPGSPALEAIGDSGVLARSAPGRSQGARSEPLLIRTSEHSAWHRFPGQDRAAQARAPEPGGDRGPDQAMCWPGCVRQLSCAWSEVVMPLTRRPHPSPGTPAPRGEPSAPLRAHLPARPRG